MSERRRALIDDEGWERLQRLFKGFWKELGPAFIGIVLVVLLTWLFS